MGNEERIPSRHAEQPFPQPDLQIVPNEDPGTQKEKLPIPEIIRGSLDDIHQREIENDSHVDRVKDILEKIRRKKETN